MTDILTVDYAKLREFMDFLETRRDTDTVSMEWRVVKSIIRGFVTVHGPSEGKE